MGLLDSLFAPTSQGGLLGGMFGEPQQTQGLVNGAPPSSIWADKQNALLGLGMGLLSGNNWQSGFANALPAMMQGAALDKQRQQEQAMARAIGGMNLGVTPEVKAAIGMNPALASAAIQQQLAPKTQIMQMPDGTLVQVDQRSGATKEIYKGALKPDFGVIGKDAAGNETFGWRNPSTMSVTPFSGPGVGGQPTMTKADVELADRRKKAEAAGISPTDPRYQRYLATGDLTDTQTQALPVDAAGRLAMGEQFLTDAPKLRQKIAGGVLSGVSGRAALAAGIGEPAEISRQVASGQDALIRAMTGAGMPQQEAAAYAARYGISSMDSVETQLSKFDQLTAELNNFRKNIYRNRSAEPDLPAPKGAQTSVTPNGVKWSVGN